MKATENKILLFGIGNSGRQDDGLGWAFLNQVKPILTEKYDIEYRYQLQVEDAELSANYEKVIFIDACKCRFHHGFSWSECRAKAENELTSHALSPETVMYLTENLYHKKPKAFILAISGKLFELSIGLSEKAEENLENALGFFKELEMH